MFISINASALGYTAHSALKCIWVPALAVCDWSQHGTACVGVLAQCWQAGFPKHVSQACCLHAALNFNFGQHNVPFGQEFCRESPLESLPPPGPWLATPPAYRSINFLTTVFSPAATSICFPVSLGLVSSARRRLQRAQGASPSPPMASERAQKLLSKLVLRLDDGTLIKAAGGEGAQGSAPPAATVLKPADAYSQGSLTEAHLLKAQALLCEVHAKLPEEGPLRSLSLGSKRSTDTGFHAEVRCRRRRRSHRRATQPCAVWAPGARGELVRASGSLSG